jgi:hypothetical protein
MTHKQDTETLPYRIRDEFFSSAEAEFYRVLLGMVKDHLLICPKVPLQDIFFVTRPNENVHFLNKMYRKSIDFLLLHHHTLKPSLGIEMIHPLKSHHRESDKFLDGAFASAGLPLVYVAVQAHYDVHALAKQFREAVEKNTGSLKDRAADFSPICPDCGITMVLRVHRAGANTGQHYYGCLNYPTCKRMIPVPAKP